MVAWTLATGSAEGRSPALMAERLVNCMVERQKPDAKTQAPLFQAPGLTAYLVVGAGPIRGIWNIGLTTYVVSGQSLYSVTVFGVVTLLGAAGTITGTGLVSMADNGTQVCIVLGQDGGGGFIYSVATGLVAITSPNYFPSWNVLYFDGYFLFNRLLSTEIFFSALFDGTTFNGTDFFNTESSSKYNIAIAQNLQLLFFFKGDKIELWYDSGAASNPFQRYAGGVLSIGCASSFSVCTQDQALFFLGSDGVVYRLQANVPIRVSTHAIETLILGEKPSLNNISTFTFTLEGHKFVAYDLPQQGRTIVFDIASGEWHERESFSALGVSIGMWRPATAMEGQAGVAILGDRFTGQLWKPEFSAYGDGTYPIYCSVISGVLQKDRRRLTIDRFEVDFQTGVGNVAAPTPSVTLYTSKDNGATFQSRGSKLIPANGGLDQLMRWFKLGSGRQWMFKLTFNDPVQRVMIGAYFDVSEGM